MKIFGHEFHMTMPLIVIGTLVVMFFVVVAYAHAAPICDKTEGVVAQLNGKYKEEILVEGNSFYGTKMQIWGNVKTKTWSITFDTGGTMCMMTSGYGLNIVIQGQSL